jgi:hypothetical protein
MSVQSMMPAPALQPVQFPPSFDTGGASRSGDGVLPDDASSGAAPGRWSGTELPPEIDKLLQQLMQVLMDATANPGSGAGGQGACGNGRAQGGTGLDPQTAEMLAYIARMFEARMQQQQAPQPDDGVAGIGGVGGGAAQAAAAPAAMPPTQDTSAVPPAATGGPADAGLTRNAGGVPQAAAIDGVAPDATKVVDTGTGSDRTFNVTNDTSRTKSFEYETEGRKKAVMTLAPGETGAFKASSRDLGVRIENSDAQGNVKPNEQLFETGGADNGQAAGVSNDDISNVDGDKDVDGRQEKMTDTLSDGRKAGDGDAIRPYRNPTDDAAAMGLAGDSSMTSNIVVSD